MALVWDNHMRPLLHSPPGDTSEAQHTDHRIPALDHTPAISHRRRRRPRARPGRVWARLRRGAHPARGGERRSGHVIMFLGGLAALGMPIIQRNNGFTAAVAKSPGGLFFIWTLMALGVTGGLAMILSARGLWNLRSRKTCRSCKC